jgi:hypothetical protein
VPISTSSAPGAVIAKVNGRILGEESQKLFRQTTSELVAMLSELQETTPESLCQKRFIL